MNVIGDHYRAALALERCLQERPLAARKHLVRPHRFATAFACNDDGPPGPMVA